MRDRAAGAKTRERRGLPARSIRLDPGAGGNYFPDAADYAGTQQIYYYLYSRGLKQGFCYYSYNFS